MIEVKCFDCDLPFWIVEGKGLVTILCPYCGSEKIAEAAAEGRGI